MPPYGILLADSTIVSIEILAVFEFPASFFPIAPPESRFLLGHKHESFKAPARVNMLATVAG
jgi:hypothetical protein